MASSPSHDRLAADVVAFIASAYDDASEPPVGPPARWPASRVSRGLFVAMARRVLDHQARHNPGYARYASNLGVDLAALADPLDAPPVPTDAFKHARLATFDPDDAVACFRSSGTTQADRSSHWLRTLAPMRAAIESSFTRYVLADRASGAGDSDRLHFAMLAPAAADVPDSSLYFMLDHLCRLLARDPSHSHFFGHEAGLDVAGLCQALARMAGDGEPVLLAGPSFAYVHFFDRAPDFRVALPPGSRLFETGGFKGQSREIPRPALHALYTERLGVAPGFIVGEYGMSELSSQLYEPCLRHALAEGTLDGPAAASRVYVPPPWCAVRVVDPISLAPLPPGQTGLIAFFDLANVDSVAAVVTQDLGTLVPGPGPESDGTLASGQAAPFHGLPDGCSGLALHGRAPGAPAKGCSVAMDMLLDQAMSRQ